MATFNGTSGDDVFSGGPEDDVAVGNGGNDTLSGGDGNDQLVGGAGADILNGDGGDDRLASYIPAGGSSWTGGSLDAYAEFDTLNGGPDPIPFMLVMATRWTAARATTGSTSTCSVQVRE